MNRLYDQFDVTVIINLFETNNMANNDGFSMFWVRSITSLQVTTITPIPIPIPPNLNVIELLETVAPGFQNFVFGD